jgi:hypothetical protein
MEYAVMLAVAASAIWALGLANEAQWSMLLIWAVLYAAALALIDYRWSKH